MQKDFKSDVREYEGHEVLRVRAYGSSFFTLGINIRYPYLLIRLSKLVQEFGLKKKNRF